MKNNLNKQVILQEMRHLLEYSCNEVALEKNYYESLHDALLKKHFRAEEVRIDHYNKTIHLSMCVDDATGFFGRKSFVEVEMKFDNIYKFLSECLEETDQNLMFYKNILNFYSAGREAV